MPSILQMDRVVIPGKRPVWSRGHFGITARCKQVAVAKGAYIRLHLAAVQGCWVIWLTDSARRGIAVTGTTHNLVIVRLVHDKIGLVSAS